MTERLLISTVRAEIVRPLGATWDAVGARLRALRNVSHRALNAGLVAARLSEGLDGDTPRATIAGRAVRAVLVEARAPAVVVDATASAAAQLYSTCRRATLRGDSSMPSARYPAPIYVRDRGWRLERDAVTGFVLAVKLSEGRGEETWARLVVAPPRKSARRRRLRSAAPWYAAINDVLTGQRGDLKLLWDERHRVWLAIMTRKHAVKEAAPEHVLGVHFGMTVPVQVAEAALDGRAAMVGEARLLWEHRRRAGEHRAALGRATRGRHGQPEVGGGRGWKRRHRAGARLEDREDRWIRTVCQQLAARVVQLARRWRCGTLAVGSYETNAGPVARARGVDRDDRRRVAEHVLFWQPARLAAAIDWAAKRSGLHVVRTPEAGCSITCRACGVEGRRDSRAILMCVTCGAVPAEINAARNLAAHGEETLASTGAERHVEVPS